MTVRGRLLIADALGLLFEGAAIIVPAVLLYGLAYGNPGLVNERNLLARTEVLQLGPQLVRPIGAVLLLFSVIYFLWQDAWLRRLRGAADPAVHRDLVYATAARLPYHSRVVRTLLWSLCGLLCVAWLGRVAGLRAWPLLWLFTLNPLLASALHSMAYDRLLWGVPWRSLPGGPDPLRRLAARYQDELDRATSLCVGLAIVATLGFTYPIPFELESYQSAQRYLPALLLGLLFLGVRLRRRACRPIEEYLAAALTPYPPPRALALAALRRAQELPYQLGGALAAGGITIATLVLLVILPRPRGMVPLQHAGPLLGVALCAILLSALCAVLWYRHALRPLLAHLLGAPVRIAPNQPEWPPGPGECPAPLSLAARSIGSFGLLVLCSCALTLLWSFIQFNSLANHRIQALARDRLAGLVGSAEQRGAPFIESGAPLQAGPARELVTGEGILYACEAPPGAPPRTVVLGHPAGLPAPPLPESVLVLLALRPVGDLALPQLGLSGVYQRLPQAPSTSLVLLYPDYRHANAERTGLALWIFCAALLFASGGLVAITTLDLARPVRYLERRASAIAGGELLRPVAPALASADELTRLTVAFEEMRRALAEKLRSSTQLNQALEVEVERRTRELSLRNQEVSEALSRLRQARDELLRRERLATMGRIAAGVTSEINNPVNVMANLSDPLAQELEALESLEASEAGAADPRRAETLRDLQSMVAALRRSAERAKEIIQATRVHLRSAEGPVEPLELAPVLDGVLALFADLRHHGVRVACVYEPGLRALAPRGDLALLLSGWLSRVAPRLRQAAQRPGGGDICLTLRTRSAARPDPRPHPLPHLRPHLRPHLIDETLAELLIEDNGPPYEPGEAAALLQAQRDLATRMTAEVEVRSAPGATCLLLRLPISA